MAKKQPRFQLVRSVDNEFFARFISANGNEVWRTSETYKRKAGAAKAIRALLDIAQDSIEIEDLT